MDIVIRLKDPSWQWKEHKDDYGKRYDYGCASTETMLCMLDHRKIPLEYWAQSKRGRGLYSRDTERAFREKAKAPLLILEDLFEKWNGVFHEIQDELGHERLRNHSIGMFAITAAAQRLRPRAILLVGFDNLMNPMLQSYYKANRGKWVTRHDWLAEHAMLSCVSNELKVEIAPWA